MEGNALLWKKLKMEDEITLTVPLALQLLIKSNNQLLKNYQIQLMTDIQDANFQMMQFLRLDPNLGWALDMDRMVYTRPKTDEEQQPTE